MPAIHIGSPGEQGAIRTQGEDMPFSHRKGGDTTTRKLADRFD
jgi:hypothetical protein